MELNTLTALSQIAKELKEYKDESFELDFNEFVSNRCEKALLRNDEYIELQKQSLNAYLSKDMKAYSEINTTMTALIESVCYKTAVSDFLNLAANINNNTK